MPIIPLFVQANLGSAEKRASAAWVIIPLMPGITVNSAKDQEWRQQSGWSYSGIAAGPPVVVTGPPAGTLPLLGVGR